jgi:hypothetical protein
LAAAAVLAAASRAKAAPSSTISLKDAYVTSSASAVFWAASGGVPALTASALSRPAVSPVAMASGENAAYSGGLSGASVPVTSLRFPRVVSWCAVTALKLP